MSGGTTTVWNAIDEWAGGLHRWQRAILAEAVKSQTLSGEAIDLVYGLFLEQHQLRQASEETLVAVDVSGRPADPLKSKLFLTSIDGLDGINALPKDAKLTFGNSLTIVYGRNGAGKTGFARLLANVCFSRHKPEIIGNIYSDEKGRPTDASFHVALDGAAPISFPLNDPSKHTELKRFSFFDSNVARRHVSESSPFEFRPSGFDVFPEMARVYKQIAIKLDADIASRDHAQTFGQSFIGLPTDVSIAVNALSHTTDIEQLKKLGVYQEAEQARLAEVDSMLFSLRANAPKDALEKATQASSDVEAIIGHLLALQAILSLEASKSRSDACKSAEAAKVAATLVGTDKFKRDFFNGVGSAEWTAFAKAAQALAAKEGASYPKTGDPCLLCERPLDAAAREHITQLLTYVDGVAQRFAENAASLVTSAIEQLEKIQLNLFEEGSRARDHISRLSPALCSQIVELFQAARNCQATAVAALHSNTLSEHFIDTTPSVAALRSILETLSVDISRLKEANLAPAIEALELERHTLRHREVLSQLLPSVELWVANARWATSASRAKSALNPRHITDKDKELFAIVVGDSYRSYFEAECRNLKCDLPVEMQTLGQKGKTVRSLTMAGGVSPDKILSEGEQRAIALADFLAEVNSNPANAGIVLDDPVTSQDHERKGLIAKRLVEEAGKRQVIVFTHDLPFLNQIVREAEASSLDFEAHWIDRDSNGAPGLVTLNDVPATSKEYDSTKRATRFLADAKIRTGSDRLAAIMSGMGALRRTVEETIAKKLFKGAIPRWEDRIIVTSIGRIAWDDSLADELSQMFVELSSYIEGHSHTDEAMGAPPGPEDLEIRIAAMDVLIKRARHERTH